MNFFNILLSWLIVGIGTLMAVASLWQYLRGKSQGRRSLYGIIAMSMLSIIAIISLSLADIHRVNLVKSYGTSLLLLYNFIIQLLYQWTIAPRTLLKGPWLKIFTGIVAVYGAFLLVAFIFHF